MSQSQTALIVSGIGLITGQPVTAEIELLPEGSGILFEVDGSRIPARPEAVVNTDRGVTLASADGKVLSIVEHFLSACAMTGHEDLRVKVSGVPELPLLDGSAAQWAEYLVENFGNKAQQDSRPIFTVSQPLTVIDPKNPAICLHAIPAETLKLTYLVDFPHPDLSRRWITWREDDGQSLLEAIAPARTFGSVSELPTLQARGLALGVTAENTLGLTDDGGYTSPLRFPNEPLRHKLLDLIGDLMLCDIPITRLKAEIIVFWGGHTAHITFGRELAKLLQTV